MPKKDARPNPTTMTDMLGERPGPGCVPCVRRPAGTVNRVTEVAFDTFAREGFGPPSRRSPRRAGVGTATVSRHFPTKELLFEAAFHEPGRTVSTASGSRCSLPAALRRRSSPTSLRSLTEGTTNKGLSRSAHRRRLRPRRRVLPGQAANIMEVMLAAARPSPKAGAVHDDVEADDVKCRHHWLCRPGRRGPRPHDLHSPDRARGNTFR